jgi:hypothetical protein
MPQVEDLLNLIPAPFVPSISFTGTEPRYIIRGQNLWLKAKAEGSLYTIAYKGNRDMGETIPVKQITGTITWLINTDLIVGAGTLFKSELRPGNFIVTDTNPSNFFVIEEIITDTSARVSRIFPSTQGAGVNANILPIMFPVGQKRGTAIHGNVAKFPGGHYLGVGDGTFKLNGQDLPIRQVEIMTVLGGAAAANGNITVTNTAGGLGGSPLATVVAVLDADSVATVAKKIKIALDAVGAITAFSTVTAIGDKIYWIKLAAAANDATMNIAITAVGGTRFSSAANSTNAVAGNTFALTKKPRYAMLDESVTPNVYTQVDYGITLPADDPIADPLITLAVSPTAGTKMLAAVYGVRVVARSDAEAGAGSGAMTGGTGGFSQPSATYQIVLALNQKVRVTFNKPMNVAEGQSAWDIYPSMFGDSTTTAQNASKLGPWQFYETVTAAELAAFNGVADGTVAGLFWDFEFADGELGDLVTFDNFAALDSEFVDLLATDDGFTPIFFSCLGRRNVVRKEGTSPGPAIAVGKPGNPEAVMRNETVATFESDDIIGVVNARGRWWLQCENSLQTAILTGVSVAPVTIRSFWDVGFRNPYNLRFLKDYAFAYSTQGFLRSIGVGDTSDVDFEFSSPVDDFTTDWITSHVLVGYDPKNKAICYFFSGREKQTGFWVTLVIPYLPTKGIWNPPILLKKANTDFIVSGVATVGQALYFLAGGRTSVGAFESKTYEFDAADGITLDCYLAWAFMDLGSEDVPQRVKGVASIIGKMTTPKVEIHGVADTGAFDLTALENGHGIANQTVNLPTLAATGRDRQKRQTIKQFSKWTARLSFSSTDGSGRFDELNLLVNRNASRK